MGVSAGRILVALLTLIAWSLACQGAVDASDAQLPRLVSQLSGGECAYEFNYRGCSTRSWFSSVLQGMSPRGRYVCVADAAWCLRSMGDAARPAIPALMNALRAGPNDFDTGDGHISPRSAIAETLGMLRDPQSVPALIAALENARPFDTDAVTGAIRSDTPAAREAIIEALAEIGHASIDAAPVLARLLGERNRELAGKSPREELERRKRMAPSNYYPADWNWDQYLVDPFSELVAEALGKIGAADQVPLLIETLDNPWAARGAIRGLALLGDGARAAIPVLQRIAHDPAQEAGTRTDAASLLERLHSCASCDGVPGR